MTLQEVVAVIRPLADTEVAKAIAPAIISAIFGGLSALGVYWFKSREPLHGAIAWQIQRYSDGSDSEEPFLVIQNRSSVPAYLKQARVLKGNLIRREVVRYAFSYDDPFSGTFPLEIPANGVASFPLSAHTSDKIVSRARWFNKVIGYVFKRHFIWIAATTISGRTIKVGANHTTNFQTGRPLWIDLRWFPAPKPVWTWEDIIESIKNEA